jgi:hypothetical protein
MRKVFTIHDHWQVSANNTTEALKKFRAGDIDCHSYTSVDIIPDVVEDEE